MAIAPENRPDDGAPSEPLRRRLRILLAEDSATNRLVATARLEAMGHRVDAVANGADAVTAVQTGDYDLVLMDVMMPQMDGLAASRAIRALPGAASQLPIVALTANASEEGQCRIAGMDGLITKPIAASHLASIIEKVVAGTLRADPAAGSGLP